MRVGLVLLLGMVVACGGNGESTTGGAGGRTVGSGSGGRANGGLLGAGTAGTTQTGGSGAATAGAFGNGGAISSAGGQDGNGGGSASGGSAGSGSGARGGAGGTVASGGGTTTSNGGISTSSGGSNGTVGTSSGGSAGAGSGLIWPNDESSANSDNWLVQNHDNISELRPRVLAIDIREHRERIDPDSASHRRLGKCDQLHKYSNASAQPMLVYELVKVVNGGSDPNYTTWNSQAFADSNIQLKDPKDPNGPNLTLCQLFEKGIINEVWCMATQNQTQCGETQETKVVYTNTDPPVKVTPLKLVGASNGDNITNVGCKVSTRIIDFNTSRGVGCHQHAMGHGWERYMDAQAIPLLRKQAARFLNWDLNTRVGAPFGSFYGACTTANSLLTDCMVWQSTTHVLSVPARRSHSTSPTSRPGAATRITTPIPPAPIRTMRTRLTRWCSRRVSTPACTTAPAVKT